MNRKMTLDVDRLAVETFAPAPALRDPQPSPTNLSRCSCYELCTYYYPPCA